MPDKISFPGPDLDQLRADGYRFAQLEMADLNGILRGKIMGLDKGLSPSGTAMSTLTLGGRSSDIICYTKFAGRENGFPKMAAKPDFSTVRKLPWTGDVVSLMFDFHMNDGTPCPVDTRHMLKRVVAEYEALGITPMAALEFEVYIFHEDAALEEKRFADLKPFGRSTDFYYLTRFPSFIGLAKEFLGRMEDIGIPVEAFHTEYGRGMFEYMLAPMPVLEAADAALRTKLYLKQLCAERGLMASFMPVMHITPGDTALGMHHNISLWRNGVNLCWNAAQGDLSDTARHFAGGMLESLPDLHVLFRPWVNSYRRMDPDAWSPVSASWALDNHTAAIRVVHGSNPPKYSRFEHRVAGADANPYLTFAGILGGGLRGIRNSTEPMPYGTGNVTKDPRFVSLTTDLAAATTQFRASPIAAEIFGALFVDHFATTREEEWQDYSDYIANKSHSVMDGAVTRWEFEHYLEWV